MCMNSQLTIEPATCHIWLADTKQLVPQQSQFEQELSTVERARADRFVNEQLRNDFVLAHGWKRRVLAAYVSQAPNELEFLDNGHGKPSLVCRSVQFNLSHSAGRVVLALCSDAEVGVDVQFRDRRVDMAGLAERFFAKEEALWFASAPESQQLDVFYQIWSLKEAYIKAVGLGMSLSLQDFAFGINEQGDLRLIRQPDRYVTFKYKGHVLNHAALLDCALAVVVPEGIDQFVFY